MNTKNEQSRTIIYKYVEVPHPAATDPVANPTSQSPKDSLAYRAWANCYQPPLSPSSSSSRSGSTSSLHSSASSTSSHDLIAKPPQPLTGPSSLATTSSSPAPKQLPPIHKTRAHSSPAILTKPQSASMKTKPSQATSSSRSKPPNRTRETSYTTTTTTTTITTRHGTVVGEYKSVASHGFHDGKGSVDWNVFRSPDWEYPLHKMMDGKKVLAHYPHYQVRREIDWTY
jgi:hypothetical protein